jgi:flavin reductase (DIM6/NTAB) family NADH-FMN oxidoreductase RutF
MFAKEPLMPFVHSFPAPAVLIGCGTIARPNLVTCSWFGTVCSEPPMVGVAIRDSRHSYPLLHNSGEFTVNLPRVADVPAVNHCGTTSGRSEDKFRHLNLTPVPCPPLFNAPMIKEFFLALACRVKHELHLGSHHLFIADVVQAYGEPLPHHKPHEVNLRADEQIVFLDGKYWSLKPLEL